MFSEFSSITSVLKAREPAIGSLSQPDPFFCSSKRTRPIYGNDSRIDLRVLSDEALDPLHLVVAETDLDRPNDAVYLIRATTTNDGPTYKADGRYLHVPLSELYGLQRSSFKSLHEIYAQNGGEINGDE